jgi:hypothetical protein
MTLANLVGHIENHPLLQANSTLLADLAEILKCSLDKKMYAELIWFDESSICTLIPTYLRI